MCLLYYVVYFTISSYIIKTHYTNLYSSTDGSQPLCMCVTLSPADGSQPLQLLDPTSPYTTVICIFFIYI